MTDSKQIMDYCQETFPNQGYSLLPSDPAKIELLRNTVSQTDQLIRGWYTIQTKKDYDETEFNAMKQAMKQTEDFIVSNGNDSSPFIFGGPNPTLLDIHVYVILSRQQYTQGSVFDKLYKHFEFERFPRLLKLVEGMRARSELKNALTQKRPQHYHWEKYAPLKPGERLALFLPLVYQ